MADLADVEAALVALIAQAVYPNGTSNPSVANVPVVIYRGWPVPGNLDGDLAAGKVNVSVYPLDNEQKTTRFPKEWLEAVEPTVNLTLAVSGNTVTAGGTSSSPINAAVTVNGTSYVYAVQPGDTLTAVATGLAALIPNATNSGPVLTVPGAHSLTATVGGVGTISRESKRQKRSLRVTFWCPDPATRDLTAPPVDAALADADYLSLPDGTQARLIYERSPVSDRVEREGLYRRDLIYSAEYPTTDNRAATQVVAMPTTITATTLELT